MARPAAPARALNIADLRRLAKRRLPRAVFDYIDGGADAELTLRENCGVFDTVALRPRCAVATPGCSLRTTVLGTPIALPLLLLSGVLLPMALAPDWLRFLASINPLSHAVDAARALFNGDWGNPEILIGGTITTLGAIAAVWIASRAFSRANA